MKDVNRETKMFNCLQGSRERGVRREEGVLSTQMGAGRPEKAVAGWSPDTTSWRRVFMVLGALKISTFLVQGSVISSAGYSQNTGPGHSLSPAPVSEGGRAMDPRWLHSQDVHGQPLRRGSVEGWAAETS